MPAMPSSRPKCDENPAAETGMSTHCSRSLLSGMLRVSSSPHVCSAAALKRSCENGMCISAVQPSPSTRARALQIGIVLRFAAAVLAVLRVIGVATHAA